MPDQARRLPCPLRCALSDVPIGPFERRALMCLHNAAITSAIPRQINQRQHNSQIQRIPKLRSGSITCRHTPRERETYIYWKANFNSANLKRSLAVMDWIHFGKNCYFLPPLPPLTSASVSVSRGCLCPGGLTLTFPLTHSPQILQHKPCRWVPCCFAVP